MPIAASGAGAGDQTRDFNMQSPNGPGASPSTLAGTDTDSPSPGDSPGASPGQSDEGLKQAVQTVRSIQVQLMDLARQFPSAAESIRASASGLRSALRNIVANPGSPEPPSPAVGG